MTAADTVSIIPSVAGGVDKGSGVVSDGRGCGQDSDPVSTRELPQLTNDEVKRYSRHLIMPEVGMDGQRRLKAGSVLCIGAGGLGSPAAMYLAAAGVGTHRRRRLRRRRLQQPAAADHPRHAGRRAFEARVGEGSAQRDQSARRRPDLRGGALVGERAEAVRALRRHPRRDRQFSDPLSDQRRVRAARQAERLRQHLPVRGAGVGVRDEGRSVLPLPVSGAAAARPRAELRRRRRARACCPA